MVNFKVYTLNSVSVIPADTPLKIANYSTILGVFSLGTISASPNACGGYLQISVMVSDFRGFAKIVFLRIQMIPCSHGTLMDAFYLSSVQEAFVYSVAFKGEGAGMAIAKETTHAFALFLAVTVAILRFQYDALLMISSKGSFPLHASVCIHELSQIQG